MGCGASKSRVAPEDAQTGIPVPVKESVGKPRESGKLSAKGNNDVVAITPREAAPEPELISIGEPEEIPLTIGTPFECSIDVPSSSSAPAKAAAVGSPSKVSSRPTAAPVLGSLHNSWMSHKKTFKATCLSKPLGSVELVQMFSLDSSVRVDLLGSDSPVSAAVAFGLPDEELALIEATMLAAVDELLGGGASASGKGSKRSSLSPGPLSVPVDKQKTVAMALHLAAWFRVSLRDSPNYVPVYSRLLSAAIHRNAVSSATVGPPEQARASAGADALIEEFSNAGAIMVQAGGLATFGMSFAKDFLNTSSTIGAKKFLGELHSFSPSCGDAEALSAMAPLLSLPLFALDIPAKSSLILLAMGLRGTARLSIPSVSRVRPRLAARAFVNSSPLASSLNPTFRTDGVTHGELLGQGVEAGEGHGPRKEFVDLVCESLRLPYSDPQELKTYSISFKKGSAIADVKMSGAQSSDPSLSLLKPGSAIVLRALLDSPFCLSHNSPAYAYSSVFSIADARWVGVKVLKVDVKEGSGGTITLDAKAETSETVPLVVAEARSPCLTPIADDSVMWIHDSATAEDARLLGWIAGQALANSLTLPTPLPVSLLQWMRMQPMKNKKLLPTPAVLPDDADFFGDLDPSGQVSRSAQAIAKLSDAEYKSYLEGEGESTALSKQDYVATAVSRTYAAPVAPLAGAFFAALANTGIMENPVIRASCASEVVNLLCGAPDDGRADFEFSSIFRFKWPEECDEAFGSAITKPALIAAMNFEPIPPTGLFGDVELPSIQNRSATKRDLLRFLTGRVRLPGLPLSEVVLVEFPYSPMTAKDHSLILQRLPSAHTCSNTLEIPVYGESLLFAEGSPFRERLGIKGEMIMPGAADDAIEQFSEKEIDQLRDTVARITMAHFLVGIGNARSYDLDDMSA